jgi:hypothetical protein
MSPLVVKSLLMVINSTSFLFASLFIKLKILIDPPLLAGYGKEGQMIRIFILLCYADPFVSEN